MRDQIIGRLKEAWPELVDRRRGRPTAARRSPIVQSARARHRLPRHQHAGHGRHRGRAGRSPAACTSCSSPRTTSTPSRAFEQGAVDYLLKPRGARARWRSPASACASGSTRPPDPMDDLLGAAVAAPRRRRRPKPREYLRWVQASVGAEHPHDPDRRHPVLSRRGQVHARADPDVRGADPQADQGADRRAGSRRVLADPSLDGGARRCGASR